MTTRLCSMNGVRCTLLYLTCTHVPFNERLPKFGVTNTHEEGKVVYRVNCTSFFFDVLTLSLEMTEMQKHKSRTVNNITILKSSPHSSYVTFTRPRLAWSNLQKNRPVKQNPK